MLLKTAKKVVIGVIGGTVVLIGVVMVLTPGPAFVVIPLGLAILATEFAWAGHLLKKLKRRARSLIGAKNEEEYPPPAAKAAPKA